MPPVTTSAAALQQLQQAQSTQQSPDQIFSGAEQSAGVPQAQQQVTGLRQAITNTTNLLNGVAPSVEGRTQNSLVTSAQANRQIQNESAPIESSLKDTTTKEAQSESDLSNLLSQATTQAQLKEQGQTDSLTNLESIYKDLYGQEQDTAAANSKAAEDAESTREFNANLSASEAASSAKASTPNKDQIKSAVAGNIVQQFEQNKGVDNKVSEETWASALNDFTTAGGSVREFWQNYGQYTNPKYVSTYAGYTAR